MKYLFVCLCGLMCFFAAGSLALAQSDSTQTAPADSLKISPLDSAKLPTDSAKVARNSPTDSLKTAADSTALSELQALPKLPHPRDVDALPDSLRTTRPTRAALLSACLPGAGQIYNRKGWMLKTPIIYGGAAVLGYMIRSNHEQYRAHREAFIFRNDDNPVTVSDAEFDVQSDASLLRNRDRYRRDRDFAVILSGIWYLLNIAEAATTAHLNEFDVSDDLSLRLQPSLQPLPSLTQPGTYTAFSVIIPLKTRTKNSSL